jgi:hypothetical protein
MTVSDAAAVSFLGVGAVLRNVQVVCPSYLPWRAEAALAHDALGDSGQARRQAEEELELARTFGTARAVGVAASGRVGSSSPGWIP